MRAPQSLPASLRPLYPPFIRQPSLFPSGARHRVAPLPPSPLSSRSPVGPAPCGRTDAPGRRAAGPSPDSEQEASRGHGGAWGRRSEAPRPSERGGQCARAPSITPPLRPAHGPSGERGPRTRHITPAVHRRRALPPSILPRMTRIRWMDSEEGVSRGGAEARGGRGNAEAEGSLRAQAAGLGAALCRLPQLVTRSRARKRAGERRPRAWMGCWRCAARG